MLGFAAEDASCGECGLSHECEVRIGCRFFYPLLVRREDEGLSVCFRRHSFLVPSTSEAEVEKMVGEIADGLKHKIGAFSRMGREPPYYKLSGDERWLVDSLSADCPDVSIRRPEQTADLRDCIEKIKMRIRKRGRWFAEWYKFEEKVDVEGMVADLVAHGNTGGGVGGILARFFARFLPRWEVAAILFGYDETIRLEHVLSSMYSAKNYMTANGMKWVWLVLVSEKGVAPRARMYVRRHRKKELGILLVDVIAGLINRNPVAVSRPAARIFKP